MMSDSEIEQLRNMMDEGYGSRAICIALGRSFNTIKDHAREYRASKGIVLPKRFEWTDEHKQRAIMLRNQGHTHKEIGEDLGCSRCAVSDMLRGNGKPQQAESQPSRAPIVPPRTFTNATMLERLTGGTWMPTRPGAMDYARVPSRGIG